MGGTITWLASYPKSGNTWLRLLLAKALSNREEPVDINEIDLPQPSIVSREVLDDLLLIDTSVLTPTEIDALMPQVVGVIANDAEGDIFIKVHNAYRLLPNGEPLFGRGVGRRVFYVVRDPRDVAISWAHHSGISIDTAIAGLNNPVTVLARARKNYTTQVEQTLLDWSGNVCSWVDQNDMPVHVMRYEDMLAQPLATLQGAVDFLGLSVPYQALEHALRCTEFSKLQRREEEVGFRERWITSTAPFFRSGRAGGWREVLTPEQQATITQAHHRVMARFGYI